MKVKNIKAFEATKYIMLGIIIGFLVTISIIIPVGASIQYTLKESEWTVVVDGQAVEDPRYPVLLLDPGYNYMAVGSIRSVCEKAGIPFTVDVPTQEVRISTKQEVETGTVSVMPTVTPTVAPTPTVATVPTKAPTPTPVPKDKEDKPVQVKSDKYETDLMYMVNDKLYICINDVPNHPKILPDNYNFYRDMVDGRLSDIITFKKKNPETNKWEVLIDDVPYIKMGYFCIEYDYYINQIKTLIK